MVRLCCLLFVDGWLRVCSFVCVRSLCHVVGLLLVSMCWLLCVVAIVTCVQFVV